MPTVCPQNADGGVSQRPEPRKRRRATSTVRGSRGVRGGPAAGERLRWPENVSMEPSGGRNSFVIWGKCDGATGPPSREVLRMAEQTGHACVGSGDRTEPENGAEQGNGADPAGRADPGDRAKPAEQVDSRRAELIEAARERWIAALTDLGGRNTLLYYKDRRAGTLDLATADPEALDKFTRTGSVRLTRLFHDVDARADAIRRVQAIYRKACELREERGIRAAYLATGMARWDELFLEPAAPVLLRGLTITPTRARYDDFDLLLEDEEEVNPVLLHKLASVFDAVIEKPTPERIAGQLARAAAQAEIPGFTILRRRVIGTFTY